MTIRIITATPHDPAPRPEDWDEIKPLVLNYLETAQLVMLARGKGPDELDPSKTFAVPLKWKTDGTYTWPGALAYYAEQHDQAPAAELVEHMRSVDFQPVTDDAEAVQAALAALRGGAE